MAKLTYMRFLELFALRMAGEAGGWVTELPFQRYGVDRGVEAGFNVLLFIPRWHSAHILLTLDFMMFPFANAVHL